MNNLGKNALEWAVFGVSCVLVLTLMGFLGYASWTHKDSPALIEFHLGEPTQVGKNWRVEVEVENKGSSSSEGVEIEVEWKKGGQTASFALPHLPSKGKRSGSAIFGAREGKQLTVSDLEARALGYEDG